MEMSQSSSSGPKQQEERRVDGYSSRLHALQVSKHKKQQWAELPLETKLLRLSISSKCQVANCSCTGWKRLEKTEILPLFQDPCSKCEHSLETHISHLRQKTEDIINWLLSMVVDVEYISNALARQENPETKKVYIHFFNLLRNCILTLEKPKIEGSIGQPPFEEPTIYKALTNFLIFKYSNAMQELKIMFELANQLFHSLNVCNFPLPSSQKFSSQEETSLYTIEYTRWLVFCHVPTYCDSLPCYETTTIFGRRLLRAVFRSIKKQILDQFQREKDTVASDRKTMLLSKFPAFLNQLEEEIYSPTSPIWKLDFKARPLPSTSTTENRPIKALHCNTLTQIEKQSTMEVDEDTPESATKRLGPRDLVPRESKRKKIDSEDMFEDIPQSLIEKILNIVDDVNYESTSNILFSEINASIDDDRRLEEKNGILEVHLLGNSLSEPLSSQSISWMIGLKNIFSQQLLEMSLEYITLLLFDPRHRVIALIKNKQPIGGICFRPFYAQGFTEIVFCAVIYQEQAKGYGYYMMNHLKDYHISRGIYNFLTYADQDTAVEYFKRQGFSDQVKLSPSVYEDYIKWYKRATLMHCELNPKIIYTQFASVAKKQKKFLKEFIKRQGSGNVSRVYPGITFFKDGGRSIPVDSIPGLEETSYKATARIMRGQQLEESQDFDTLSGMLRMVLNAVLAQDAALPFRRPVQVEIAPDYYDHIKYPMDLGTMAERLNSKYYVSRRLFIADMTRIFTNCKLYNAPETHVYDCAVVLQQFFQTKMKEELANANAHQGNPGFHVQDRTDVTNRVGQYNKRQLECFQERIAD